MGIFGDYFWKYDPSNQEHRYKRAERLWKGSRCFMKCLTELSKEELISLLACQAFDFRIHSSLSLHSAGCVICQPDLEPQHRYVCDSCANKGGIL